MVDVLLHKAIKLERKRKIKKVWGTVVRILALAVVFCTTYVLILPAITSQSAPVCGYEEHTHTETCWALPAAELTGCGIPDDAVVVHRHNEFCFDEEGELRCVLPEIAVHSHGEECYAPEKILACPVTHVHSAECVRTESRLICGLEEAEAHVHDETCSEIQMVLLCEEDAHAHEEGCYAEESVIICEREETEGHAHNDSCYAVVEVPCTEPSVEEHTHDENCYQDGEQKLICTMLVLHSHDDSCLDADGVQICGLPEVTEHIHSDACLVIPQEAEPVLVCDIKEHTHDVGCFPLEEEPVFGMEYICGYSTHEHNDAYCYEEDGSLSCSIPEHTHEAACVVEDWDLTADVEDASMWEEKLAELEYTGVWADDLVRVAESQLGYTESRKNCVLADNGLYGYTRYGEWYGDLYGQWDDMFVSFCLQYAGIPEEEIPGGNDTAEWMEQWIAAELYADAEAYMPVKGDLVFWDSDADGIADMSGIVCDPDRNGGMEVIAGDTEDNCVDAFVLQADMVVGYGRLPRNPMNPDDWKAAETVSVMLAELPEADVLAGALRERNESGDRAGYEALLQEAVSRMEKAENAYNALDDAQKEQIAGLERLDALKALLEEEGWQQFAVLAEDGAALVSLAVDGAEIVRTVTAEEEGTETEEIPGNAVRNMDTIRYTFTAAAESYYTDIRYGEAAVKFELVLPLPENKAVFVLEEMSWLEDSSLTVESRLIHETETVCQVLTGYKRLTADETNGIVVPGSFTETAVVQVLDMAHEEQVVLILSGAMEHNVWDGICELHQAEEKLTVAGEVYQVYAPAAEEEKKDASHSEYESFRARIEELSEQDISLEEMNGYAREILEEVVSAYHDGMLDISELEALGDALRDPLGLYAEYATGTAWMLGLPDPEPEFQYRYSDASENAVLQSGTVSGQAVQEYKRGGESDQQIPADGKGGENVSEDGKVSVSKTIYGTDIENVFDITLEIDTTEEIKKVYEDPDMAVVVVMDISNTMITNNMTDSAGKVVTRYEAAMNAGEHFLKTFAEKNNNISKVGYVAFNTDAHKIFDLSTCNESTDDTLIFNMRDLTSKIVDKYGDTEYYKEKRFTNIEAGLKMAADMLDNAPNRHKYIIFISDGFPTTYLESGYTGWDPNTDTGTNGANGVFYDAVRNVHCDYGTSYSDTAAIKARTLAVELKEEGVNIFSIGVDVGGQNLWNYHNQENGITGGFSVVERRRDASYYNRYGYEIGTKHSMLTSSGTDAEKDAMAQDFKNWLRGSFTRDANGNITANSGIGSGYYYDSENVNGLMDAYNKIFAEIEKINAESAHLDWVATDPMSDFGVHDEEVIEFIGFWDPDETGKWVLVEDDIEGESGVGLYDNTADFHEDIRTIHWNIKESGYEKITDGGVTTYRCVLHYRIRLTNENDAFVEGAVTKTNGETSMIYRIIEVEDGQTRISDPKEIDFPIPKVIGYLADLQFTKIQPTGNPLEGAEFKLTHDTENCGYCQGDGKSHVSISIPPSVSDRYGIVSFHQIPSGHKYILTETKVPDGYIATTNTYQVTVAYDELTVTITDKDGKTVTWQDDDSSGLSIVNDMYYALPETGGAGTYFITFSGLLILAGSFTYLCVSRRKRQKGGN